MHQRRGTSTARLNSATSVPSCLWTRVCTFTIPRSGFDCDGRTSSTSRLGEQRVAVEHRRGMRELLGGEVGDRLAGHVGHRHAQRERVDERAHHHVAALLRLRRVHVVDVQRVVVHGEQAEQVVVRLGDRLGGPVLVHGADLEVLQVAAVGARAGGLALRLARLDRSCLGVAHGPRNPSHQVDSGVDAQPQRLLQAARNRRPGAAPRDPLQALADDPLPRLLEREDGGEGAGHRAAGGHPARQPRGRRSRSIARRRRARA